MNRLAIALATLAVAFSAASQSELAAAVAEQLDTAVLEEATNSHGTRLILVDSLGPAAKAKIPLTIRNVVTDLLKDEPPGVFVFIYPAPPTPRGNGGHVASIVTKEADGRTVGRSLDWVTAVNTAARAGGTNLLDIESLTFTFGETRSLASTSSFPQSTGSPPRTPPVPATPRTPSPPRNGCVSSTSATGSSMTCYTDGRVTYRSTCTVDSRGNISCRSDSY